MIQEYGMHSLTNVVVATERERQVAHPSTDMSPRQILTYPSGSLNEIDRIIIMLFNTRSYGQHIRVENDIFRSKPYLIYQNAICPFAHLNLATVRIGLPLLVKSHDDDCRSKLLHLTGVRYKDLLSFLQGNRVDDTFSLHTFQSGTYHFPLGRVNHNGHTGYFRFRSHQIQEGSHLLCGIQQAIVHIHVDDQSAVFHLLAGYRQSLIVFLLINESQKLT